MQLKEIQEQELIILKECIKIFQKYNIRYYMLGGTFLGAIRHKGFIPWDDDIDIGIPRNDYDKFCEVVNTELKFPLCLSTYNNDPNNNRYHNRIVNKEISFIRDDTLDGRTDNLWIDIFPLDGMPNNIIFRKLHQFHLLFLRLLLQYSKFNNGVNIKVKRSLFERILIKLGFVISKICHFNTKKRLDKIDKSLRKYKYDSSNYVVNFMGAYKFKEMFPRVLYENSAEYEFEDIKLYAPADYDKVLTQMYGDYLTPPQTDQRFSHSIRIDNNAEHK